MNLAEYIAWLASGNSIKYGPSIHPAAQPRPAVGANGFFDDFNGSAGSPPDPTKWTPQNSLKYAISNILSSNVVLDGNGNMAVMAQVDANKDGDWNSGIVSCNTGLGYGLYAASMQLPIGQGIHTTFWSVGPNHRFGGAGTWPGCGETDIAEHVDDGNIYGTIHGPMYQLLNDTTYNQSRIQSTLGFNPSQGFHLYWLNKAPGLLTFGVDGTIIGKIGKASIPHGAPWELDVPQTVIFSVTVNGPNNWGGGVKASTPDQVELLVDYFAFQPA